MPQARPGEPGRPGTPVGRPGGTVAGRYRLDTPRPHALPGAERWSATDQILARDVTVTLVTGDRTSAVLDAARRAALVVDPRLVRILDVGSADGTGYVVTEAVEGRSLATLAARAPLGADQARAVVGEAAAALEEARRRGVHHLALRPESVVLTSASRVVVDGLAVDGELLGAGSGGAHARSRTDAVGLVRVLYAALTGRWPAGSAPAAAAVPTFDEWSAGPAREPAGDDAAVDPGLPAAPEHDGTPLPPAELVAGIPADLDTLCAVTLGPHDDGPHSPGELVRELEPWRAVRADEIFRAADAGRWPALPGPTGSRDPGSRTTPAPPTGSSPMSDDQQDRTPTAKDAPAPRPGASTPAGTGAAAAGAAAGAGAATGAGAASATGQGTGAGAAATGAAATGAATGAAAGAAAGGAAGSVARQSVRSVLGSVRGAGSRRPGTPPPAQPAPGTFTPSPDGAPLRSGGRPAPAAPAPDASSATTPATGAPEAPPSIPPARSGSASEPAAPAAPAPGMPPAIPPAGRTAATPAAGPTERATAAPGADTRAAEATGAPGQPAPERPAPGTGAGSGTAAPESSAPQTAAPETSVPEATATTTATGTATPGTTTPGAATASTPERDADRAVAGITSAGAAAAASSGTGATASGSASPGNPTPAAASGGPATGAASPGNPATGTTTTGAAAAPARVTSPGNPPADDAPRDDSADGSPTTAVRRTTSAFTPSGAARPAGAESAPAPAPRWPGPGAPARRAEDAPAAAPSADDGTAADGGSGPGRPVWDLPFPAEQEEPGFGQRRIDPTRWVLGLVALAVVVGLVVAIGNVLAPFGSGDDDAGSAPAPSASAPAPEPTQPAPADGAEAPPVQAVPPVIAAVTSIDPSDDDGEHEELIGRLTDGDPATTWYTHTYNRPDFAGFKDAVGLVITLQAPATVSAITLDVNGSGGNVEVRSTDAANPTAGDVLASGPLSPQTVLTLSQPTETQSIVLWFTALAQAPDGANKIEISTLSVS